MSTISVNLIEVSGLRSERIARIDSECMEIDKAKLLATVLHECMCNKDHVESCSWKYDKGEWTEFSRVVYRGLAENLLKIVTYEQALALLIMDLIGDVL